MKTKRMALPAALLLVLLLAGAALAMASANYQLTWYVQMGVGSGGLLNSAGYKANLTAGQTAVGAAGSANYDVSLGYWAAFPFERELYLPAVMKD